MARDQLSVTLDLKNRGRFSSEAQAAARDVEAIGDAGVRAETKSRGWLSRIGSGIGGIAKTATKVAGVAGAAISGIFGAVAIKKGLDRLTTIEDATASLNVLLGDTAKTAEFMDGVLESVTGTPFNLDQFANAGKNLVAFGADAQKVPGYLTAIGEAAAASGKGAEAVDWIVDALGKATAAGKVGMETINSLSAQGVPALQILANSYGVNTDKLREMIRKGALPAAEAIDHLTKGILEGTDGAAGATVAFAGTMEGLRETLSGAKGGLGAAVSRFGAKIIGPFTGLLTGGMTTVADTLDNVGAKVEKATTAMADSIGGFIDRAEGWWEQFQAGQEYGLRMTTAQRWGDTFQTIVDDVDYRWEQFRQGMKLGIGMNSMQRWGRDFAEWRNDVGEGIDRMRVRWSDFRAGLSEGVDATPMQAFGASVAGWSERLEGVWDNLKLAADGLWPSIKSIVGSLAAAAGRIGISTWEVLLALLEVTAQLLVTTLVPALERLATFLEENEGAATALVGAYLAWKAVAAGIGVGTAVASTVGTANKWIRDHGTKISGLITKVRGWPAAIWSTFGDMRAWAALRAELVVTKIAAIREWTAKKIAAARLSLGIKMAFIKDAIFTRVFLARMWLETKITAIRHWTAMRIAAIRESAATAAAWIRSHVRTAAAAVASTARAVAATVAGWATMAATATLNAAVVVAGWVLMGVQAMAQAVRMAAAWFIAMGPVGWVIAAIIGLVALIVANWDKVKEWTVRAFNAVWGFIKDVWERIKAGATLVWTWIRDRWNEVVAFISGIPAKIAAFAATMWQAHHDAVDTVKQWISDRWDDVVDFVTKLPGRIATAAAGMWDGIKTAFREAINWIIDRWNGLSFGIPEMNIPGIGTVGGQSFSVPEIPRLHTGGTVTGGGLAVIEPREEAVVLPPAATVAPVPDGQLPAEALSLSGLGGGSEPRVVQLVVDRRVLTEVVIDGLEDRAAFA